LALLRQQAAAFARSALTTQGRFVRYRSLYLVGFEVFKAVVLKSIFFWDMTPCHIPEEDTLQPVPYLDAEFLFLGS
jgi:hypothetical protein